MKNKLYLECTSGISGDMAVAALLDLGASREKLKKVLKSLPVKGFDIKISRVVKSGIDACDFDVVLDEEHENHDHDMGYCMDMSMVGIAITKLVMDTNMESIAMNMENHIPITDIITMSTADSTRS